MNAILPLFVRWDVNPTMISIGSFEIRYYGLMWALALGISAYIFSHIIKREGYPDKLFDSIFWYGVLSTIIGARLGHCLFYDPGYYLTHPVEILYIHQGGLASHGAAVGLLVGLWLFSRKNKMPYIWSLDRIAIAVGIAGALVRIGNLMNSEIYGHATSLPWGFVFVRAGETQPMHPTQIYEAAALPRPVRHSVLDVLWPQACTASSGPDVRFLSDLSVRLPLSGRVHQESAGGVRADDDAQHGPMAQHSVHRAGHSHSVPGVQAPAVEPPKTKR